MSTEDLDMTVFRLRQTWNYGYRSTVSLDTPLRFVGFHGSINVYFSNLEDCGSVLFWFVAYMNSATQCSNTVHWKLITTFASGSSVTGYFDGDRRLKNVSTPHYWIHIFVPNIRTPIPLAAGFLVPHRKAASPGNCTNWGNLEKHLQYFLVFRPISITVAKLSSRPLVHRLIEHNLNKPLYTL